MAVKEDGCIGYYSRNTQTQYSVNSILKDNKVPTFFKFAKKKLNIYLTLNFMSYFFNDKTFWKIDVRENQHVNILY